MTAWLAAKFGGLWVKIAAVGAVFLGILLAALRLIAIGRKQEQAAEEVKTITTVATEQARRNEIDALTPTGVDERLSRWVSDAPKR